jgi:hypothetical protein
MRASAFRMARISDADSSSPKFANLQREWLVAAARLTLLDPRNAVALKGFDRLSSGVLHSHKDDCLG